MEWQPIETAPKDGTHILLYSDQDVLEGYWCDGRKRFIETGYCFVGCGCCADSLTPPTHWMPLPPPPSN